MARKHHNRDSGVLVFDSRTNTVMADELNPENIKQKISAIREVVLNRSNNEIVLVLQYHDYDVDKAIASFMEDGAAQVLKEWNFTGKKSNNKKKKKKNKKEAQQAQQPPPQTEAPKEDDTSSAEVPVEVSVNLDLVTTETAKSDAMHSPTSPSIESGIEPDSVPNESAVDPVVLDSIPNGPVPVTHDPSSLPIGVPPSQDPVQPEASLSRGAEVAEVEGSADEGRNRRLSPSRLSVSSDRVRTMSESSNRSQASSHAAEKGAAGSTKRPGAGLERSVKDLQRSTVSLQRYRNLLNEEIDASVKRLQAAFQELHQRLDDREVALLLELDHVKAQAIEILSKRQQQAVDLKVRTARAPTMTEAQLSELRADIKHFISDRKVDEEIGKTTRFARDQHTMLNTIDTFGEVVPVKCVYSTRRPSLSSVSSINTTSSVSEPPTPTSPSRPFPLSPTATANQKDEVFDSLVTTGSVTVTTAPGMSTAEMVELQQRLQENLRQQVRPMGISTASPERRRPQANSAPPQGPGRDRTNQNRDRASQGQQANRDRGTESPQRSGRNQRRRDRDRRDARRTNDSQDSANQSQDSGPKPSGQERKPQSAAPPGGPSGDGRPVDNNRQRNQSPRHNQRNQHPQKGGGPKVNGSVAHSVQNGPKENGPKVAEKDMNGASVPSDALPQRKPKQRGGAQNKEQPNAIPNGVSAPEGTATTNGDWE